MTGIVIDIYRFFQRHGPWGWILFIVVTGIAILSTLSISYKEDIRDFLPFGDDESRAMEIYQDISGANMVYAVITSQSPDNEDLMNAVDLLVETVERLDTVGYVSRTIAGVDEEMAGKVSETLYDLMPLLLNESDYDRIDSLLSCPGFVDGRLLAAKELLQMPASSFVTGSLTHDPLGLFSPAMGRIVGNAGATPDGLDTGDGYFISADGSAAFVIFKSPFGPNETNLNGLLIDMLERAATEVMDAEPGMDIQLTGSPVIAVGNARSIKHDSLWSVIIAALAIMALLIYVFRNARNIMLIFISVAWGWLFAMGAIGLYYDSISIIVVGIASVMLGIAVKYHLHLVDHLSGCGNRPEAIGQVVVPLVVGNITTVGAFLCLVPLDSPALHDLGLFSAMLLVGTILFVLLFLPHLVKIKCNDRGDGTGGAIAWLARLMRPGSPRRLWWLLLPTVIFGYFSFKTGFDPDLRNINYLTDGQKAVFDRLSENFGSNGGDRRIYVAATGDTWDEATAVYEEIQEQYRCLPDSLISRNALPGLMLVSRESQLRRLDRWEQLTVRRDSLLSEIRHSAHRQGFNDNAFLEFCDMLSRRYHTVGEEEFRPLAETLLRRNLSIADGQYSIVDILELNDSVDCEQVMSDLRSHAPRGVIVFDVEDMSSTMTGVLADNFNYIGLMCGLIVFLFLWLSMGRIELAIVSFVPMAVSWIWILGIMGMFGLQFNIVNIILGTFIFGQGDDYTIFVTEGLTYEYGFGRRIVDRFRNSIIVSALMMFAGIGVLVFAGHPAMRSLGQVAVIGMFTVVVMACVIPPMLFRFLTCNGNGYRLRPLTLRSLCCNILWYLTGRKCRFVPGVGIDIVMIADDNSLKDGIELTDSNRGLDRSIAEVVRRKGISGPVMIVGSELLMGKDARWYSPGRVTVLAGSDRQSYNAVKEQYINFDAVCGFVLDCYLYKGVGVWHRARRKISGIRMECPDRYRINTGERSVVIDVDDQGETAMVTALMNPGMAVTAHVHDKETEALLKTVARTLPTSNLTVGI